mgnify:CR=1 FL=1
MQLREEAKQVKSIRLSRLLLAGMVVLLTLMPVGASWAKPPDQDAWTEEWDEEYLHCPGFWVYEKGQLDVRVQIFYDGDGNWLRTVGHYDLVGYLYNVEDETYRLPEIVHQKAIWNDAGGLTIVGLWSIITIPGEGVIYHDAGRIEIDAHGHITFSAGRHDYFDGDKDVLCAALTPP